MAKQKDGRTSEWVRVQLTGALADALVSVREAHSDLALTDAQAVTILARTYLSLRLKKGAR